MITFDPLWETMKNKGISQYKLIKEHKISTGHPYKKQTNTRQNHDRKSVG